MSAGHCQVQKSLISSAFVWSTWSPLGNQAEFLLWLQEGMDPIPEQIKETRRIDIWLEELALHLCGIGCTRLEHVLQEGLEGRSTHSRHTPLSDPNCRSDLGFYNLHHRCVRVQNRVLLGSSRGLGMACPKARRLRLHLSSTGQPSTMQ